MRVRCPRLWHVGTPKNEVSRVIPISRFRYIRLFAPSHGGCRRQVAIPIVETHADAAEQAQIARPRRVTDHRHGRDRGEPKHSVGSVVTHGIGICRRDDFRRFVPGRADKAALTACLHVTGPQDRIRLDLRPGFDRALCLTQLTPDLHKTSTHQWVLHPVRTVEIPAVACAACATPGFVIGKVRACARIIRLLGFPGHDPGLHIDLPGTGPRAVHPVGGAHDLIVTPTVPIRVLPVAILPRYQSVSVRERLQFLGLEEVQSIQNVAHGFSPYSGLAPPRPLRRGRAVSGDQGFFT